MVLLLSPFDQSRALELIEQAERDRPTCECGQHTLPVAYQGDVWLQCATLQQPKSTLRRLVTLDFAARHTSYPIVDLTTRQAA